MAAETHLRRTPGDIALRPAVAADEAFLLALFASTRTRELAVLGPDSGQADAFSRMQFDLQRREYGAAFPEAAHLVIMSEGEPVGRLIVARSPVELRIVDLALLSEFRRRGVGAHVVRGLIDEARAARLPLRCHVVFDNEPARSFWAQLGFVPAPMTEPSGAVYLPLEWSCAT